MKKLTKPPLNLVSLKIDFPPNLKVSEKRSEYYELVKEEYPLIVFPESKGLVYDFSDCHFRNNAGTTQLRIATHYFAMETVKYESVDIFWQMLKKHFIAFTKCFSILDVNSLRLSYDNLIKVEKGVIGDNFSDYLSLDFSLKDKKQRKFITCDGSFVFAVDNGIMQIEIHPRQNPISLVWDTLDFKIDCQVNTVMKTDQNLDEVKNIFELAHGNIEDLFFSSLSEKYLKAIQ